ncbi:MAG: HEAT repeat domain-containing protein [Chloroflexota bacterium]|nr:HEAT repeat domain-containing protein [Chloroflexota bacterium]
MMQHTYLPHATYHPHHISTPSKTRLLKMGLFLIAVILLAAIMLPAVSRATSRIAALPDGNARAPETTARGASGDAVDAAPSADRLDVFEQNAQALAVPVLIDALNDSDAGVRADAARILGLRREYSAIGALAAATRGVQARVRSEAARSLGEIDAWQELPRLERLEATDGNVNVRDAAQSAVAMVHAQIAKEIGLLAFQVRDVAVTASDPPRLYAATQSDLYARRGTVWQVVSALPDAPLALATGSDENSIYLATESLGLYRSSNGGVTWEHVQFNVNTSAQLMVTAIVVDAQDSHGLYAALASQGAHPGNLVPLGMFSSSDEGKTWMWLPNSPSQAITTRLFVDPDTPGFLYGLADDTPWRYQVPSEF